LLIIFQGISQTLIITRIGVSRLFACKNLDVTAMALTTDMDLSSVRMLSPKLDLEELGHVSVSGRYQAPSQGHTVLGAPLSRFPVIEVSPAAAVPHRTHLIIDMHPYEPSV
jgi:hypothetical protein